MPAKAALLVITVLDPAGHAVPGSAVFLPEVADEFSCVSLTTASVEKSVKRGDTAIVRAWAEGYAPVDRAVTFATRTRVHMTLTPTEGGSPAPWGWIGCQPSADTLVDLNQDGLLEAIDPSIAVRRASGDPIGPPYADHVALTEQDRGSVHAVTATSVGVYVTLAAPETGSWGQPRVSGSVQATVMWPTTGPGVRSFVAVPLGYGDLGVAVDHVTDTGDVIDTWTTSVTLAAPQL